MRILFLLMMISSINLIASDNQKHKIGFEYGVTALGNYEPFLNDMVMMGDYYINSYSEQYDSGNNLAIYYSYNIYKSWAIKISLGKFFSQQSNVNLSNIETGEYINGFAKQNTAFYPLNLGIDYNFYFSESFFVNISPDLHLTYWETTINYNKSYDIESKINPSAEMNAGFGLGLGLNYEFENFILSLNTKGFYDKIITTQQNDSFAGIHPVSMGMSYKF